jgi:hypothetical protein
MLLLLLLFDFYNSAEDKSPSKLLSFEKVLLNHHFDEYFSFL